MAYIKGNPFRILALSGGGYRGLFTATVLQKLEEHIGKPLYTQFELIAGTSIGGINALTLAAGIPASKAVEFFISHGGAVFYKQPFGLLSFFQPRYKNTGLRNTLEAIFKAQTVKQLKTNIVIPSVNYTKGSMQIFKTPHHDSLKDDAPRTLVDVALSTSAAPTYFPIHRAKFGDMVDGGIVANHPGLLAYIEARQFVEAREEDIHMLHIGTMSSGTTSPGTSPNFGVRKWMLPKKRLTNLILSAQEIATADQLKLLLRDRYFSLDATPTPEQKNKIGLDVHTQAANTILQQSAEIVFKNAIGNAALRTAFQINERTDQYAYS